jgi:uncharacterized membrane protein YgcG
MDNEKRAELLLTYLPKVKNKKEELIRKQSSQDIIRAMVESCLIFQKDYNKIPKDFFKNLQDLWQFTKNVFIYKEDSSLAQDLKSPSVMITEALNKSNTIDCKGYSNFIAGCLQNFCINENEGYDWYYKFVSYDDGDPSHVYIVANEFVLDCCENKFNKESPCYSYICCNPFTKDSYMAVNRISGKKNLVNINPSPYGRQGKIGEGSGGGSGSGGNSGGGHGSGGGSNSGGGTNPNNGAGNQSNLNLFAPDITVQQPSTGEKTGSVIIKDSQQVKALYIAGVDIIVVTPDGKIFISKTTNATDAIGNELSIDNIPVGKYYIAFKKIVKGKSIIGRGTKFQIKSTKDNTNSSGGSGGSPNPNPNTTDNTKQAGFSPAEMAVGAGILIGGYLLLNKKK